MAAYATIEKIFTPTGFGDCTLPTALPHKLDALENDVFTFGYIRAKGSAAFIQTSSIGTFTATAPPTKIFTLQTDTTTYQPKQIGWTQETCKRTCNADNRSPCDTTVRISNRERGVTLKEPHSARCAQPHVSAVASSTLVPTNRSLPLTVAGLRRNGPYAVCLRESASR